MPFQGSHFVSLQSYLVWLVSPVGSLCPERPCPHSKDDHCYCWYWYLDFVHNTHTSPISYSWLFYINPNYYGFSASANILLNNFNTDCVGSVFECFPSSPQYYLKYFNFDDVNPYLHITVRTVAAIVNYISVGSICTFPSDPPWVHTAVYPAGYPE